jgi:hypothetical protein
MIKYFCDVCGEETERNYVSQRLKPQRVYGLDKHNEYRVVDCEVIVAINESRKGGVICEDCLRLVIMQPERKEENALDSAKCQVDTIKW